MNISAAGLELIESFEGFRADRYNDGTGVETIGYGTTAADVDPLPEHVTQAQAQQFLATELFEKYEPAVNALGLRLNQNQYDALCSFVYNLGPGILGPQHTIGALLRAHDLTGAANALLLYDDPGTSVTAGLESRRELERKLFLTPVKPQPTPDPMHYLWYPDALFHTISHGKINERDLVQAYDKLRRHPFIHRPRLRVLRDECHQLAARIEGMAEDNTSPAGFLAQFHRGWRARMLDRRGAGQRLAP